MFVPAPPEPEKYRGLSQPKKVNGLLLSVRRAFLELGSP
jgi:hypothetical protein